MGYGPKPAVSAPRKACTAQGAFTELEIEMGVPDLAKPKITNLFSLNPILPRMPGLMADFSHALFTTDFFLFFNYTSCSFNHSILIDAFLMLIPVLNTSNTNVKDTITTPGGLGGGNSWSFSFLPLDFYTLCTLYPNCLSLPSLSNFCSSFKTQPKY